MRGKDKDILVLRFLVFLLLLCIVLVFFPLNKKELFYVVLVHVIYVVKGVRHG